MLGLEKKRCMKLDSGGKDSLVHFIPYLQTLQRQRVMHGAYHCNGDCSDGGFNQRLWPIHALLQSSYSVASSAILYARFTQPIPNFNAANLRNVMWGAA